MAVLNILDGLGRVLRFWTKRKGLERDLAPGPYLVGRAVSLDLAGTRARILEKEKDLERDVAPGPCLVRV